MSRRAARSWANAIPGLLLEPASWLPGLLLVGGIGYTAWASWWL